MTVQFDDGLSLAGALRWQLTDPLILRGQDQASTILDADGNSRVIENLGSAMVTVDRLTVTGGYVTDSMTAMGAGILSYGAVTVIDSTVTGNTAAGTNGEPFAGGATGGGIYTVGPVSVTNSTIVDNTATGGNGDFGGSAWAAGIGADGGTVTLVDSTVAGNTATGGSGGTFGGNAQGAGVHSQTTIAATNATIAGNTATGGSAGTFAGDALGGGIYAVDADIVGSVLAGNTATAAGYGEGGAAALSGRATITNSTITGNAASALAGGIYTKNATMHFATVVNNSAPVPTANLASHGLGELTATASIIATESGAGSCDGFAIAQGAYNATAVGDSSCGLTDGSNVSLDWEQLELGALGDNGGPTETMLPSSGSLLNLVVPETVGLSLTPPISADQRGLARTGNLWTISAAQPAVSSITEVSPTSGPTTGGTALTITGTGFQPGSTVSVGGSACAPVVVSASQITCTTGAHAAGLVDVAVARTNGFTLTMPDAYTYLAPAPGPDPTPSPDPTAVGVAQQLRAKAFPARVKSSGVTVLNKRKATTRQGRPVTVRVQRTHGSPGCYRIVRGKQRQLKIRTHGDCKFRIKVTYTAPGTPALLPLKQTVRYRIR